MSYLVNVLLLARHKSANNAATYQQDAATKWELTVLEQYMDSNRVGLFKSRHLNSDVHGTAISPSTPYQKTLPDLCDWWYRDCLGLKDRPADRPRELLKLVLQERSTDISTINFNTYKRTLRSQIKDPDVIWSLMRQVQTLAFVYSNQVNGELLGKADTRDTRDDSSSGKRDSCSEDRDSILHDTTMEASPTFQSNVRIKKGKIELDYKEFGMCKGTIDKVKYIERVRNDFISRCGGRKELLTPGSKRWCNRYFCIVECLEIHCGGSVKKFMEEHNCPNDFPPSKFSCKCTKK